MFFQVAGTYFWVANSCNMVLLWKYKGRQTVFYSVLWVPNHQTLRTSALRSLSREQSSNEANHIGSLNTVIALEKDSFDYVFMLLMTLHLNVTDFKRF